MDKQRFEQENVIERERNREQGSDVGQGELLEQGGKISRRKLIASMGLTGAAVLSGGLVSTLGRKAFAADTDTKKKVPVIDDADRISYRYAQDLKARTVGDKLRESVSVKDFGAQGDGIVDDTAAIQNGIDYLGKHGGGVLYFPVGTYIVSPHLNERIQLKSNVSLMGTGAGSIIKIKDDAGDYFTIFGQLNDGPKEVLENITVRDLKIDQNPTGNTTCDIGGQTTRRQHVFSFYNFENVVIENVEFNPTTAVNTITLNKRTAKLAAVRNCVFNFVRGKTTDPNYDNSAIYFQCFQHIAIGNQFNSEIGQGIGAIETHTGISVIANNITRGYQVGIHAVPGDYPDPDMNIVGNTFVDVGRGVLLWGPQDVPIQNVTISSNVMKVNNYTKIPFCGIGMGGNKDGDLINVVISSNTILFEEVKEDMGAKMNLAYVAGIILEESPHIQNVVISNNTISKSPGYGISVGSRSRANASVRNVVIQGNAIANAGNYLYGGKGERKDYIEVRSLAKNISIRDNMILDTYSAPRATAAIRAKKLSKGSSNIKVRENLIDAKDVLENDLHQTVQTYPDHLELVSPGNRRFKLKIDDSGKITSEQI